MRVLFNNLGGTRYMWSHGSGACEVASRLLIVEGWYTLRIKRAQWIDACSVCGYCGAYINWTEDGDARAVGA